MEKLHIIEDIKFENQIICLKIDGNEYKYKINELSEKLFSATIEEKNDYCISPSGYGIHWTKIDEDISIEAMLKNKKA